jgi:hypothetical protein
VQHPDGAVPDVGAFFVEAVGAVEARVAPEGQSFGAGRDGVAFGVVKQRVAQARSVQGGIDVDAADLPGGVVVDWAAGDGVGGDWAGGDHADELAVRFGDPQRAALPGVVGGKGVEFGHLPIHVHLDAGIG